jgi:hypothetical protein
MAAEAMGSIGRVIGLPLSAGVDVNQIASVFD